jgi:hypothetical protein
MLSLPTVIVALTTVMGIRANQPGLLSFKALVTVLNKCADAFSCSCLMFIFFRVQGKLTDIRPPRSHPLSLLVDHVVDLHKIGVKDQPYKSLSGNMLMFLMEKRMNVPIVNADSEVTVEECYQVVWFIFEYITKTMALGVVSKHSKPTRTVLFQSRCFVLNHI